MKITKHGDREKIQAYLDSKIKPFTCVRCGCEWAASIDENEVYYNAFLGTWQSNCPEEHCGGVGLCDKQKNVEAPTKYENDIYPLTIVKDRYNGTYSGGRFIAWNCNPYSVPEESQVNDDEAFYFWNNLDWHKHDSTLTAFAVGDTIEDAIKKLHRDITKRSEEK